MNLFNSALPRNFHLDGANFKQRIIIMERNIIITGASGNLGAALTETFLKDGYTVFGIDHQSRPLFQRSENYWEAGVELQDAEATQYLVDDILGQEIEIETLVSTAGGFMMGKLEETQNGDILSQFNLNFISAFNIMKPVLIQMRKQGHGKIFLVGARPGLDIREGSNSVAYAFSKSLIFRLAELLNHNYSQDGIRTWVIVPGTIDTPQNREAMPGNDFSEWVSPSTIAETVLDYCKGNAKESMMISF